LPNVQECSLNYTRTESDHSPLEATVTLPVNQLVLPLPCLGQPLKRRQWCGNQQSQYSEALQSQQCTDLLQAVDAACVQNNVDQAVQSIHQVVDLAADLSGMPSRVAGIACHVAKHQPFLMQSVLL